MQKSEFIAKIKKLAKQAYAEKSNPLEDPKDIAKELSPFPVIDQFPPLQKIMDDLFDFQFEPFVEDIEWVAPRPTTFRIKLVNNADFYLIYQGDDNDKGLFIAQVAGKKYFLESLPEEQQASEAIARLLRYNYNNTPKTDTTELDSEDNLELGTEEPTTPPEPPVPDSVDDLNMDVLDKFFKKFSYKFPKGYPDINDEQDVFILEGMLKSLLGEEFNPLKFFDLQKYGGPRLKVLNNKIQSGEPFDMASGEKIVLNYTKPEYEELFKNADAAAIKKLGGSKINFIPFFKDANNKEYAIKDLLKTTDFGGRGKGSGTKAEDIALLDISTQLKEIGPISVVLSEGGKPYKGIDGATTFQGTPKADFSLDAGEQELIFISHKDGSTAKDFQQYSGFKGITQYPEIQSFVKEVRKLTGGAMQRGQSFRRKINSDEVKRKAVYGVNFGSDKFGINNCQILLQGPLKLDALDDGTYLLGATHKIITPVIPSGDYEPYLYVTFRSDRNNGGVKDARFGIYPEAYKRSAQEI